MNWFEDWKLKRLLKKNGCKTLKQYNRKYDSDIERRAVTLKGWYKGYSYLYQTQEHTTYLFLEKIEKWCDLWLSDKWRYDIHRLCDDGFNGTVLNEFGDDEIVFAFKTEEDLNWFKMKWG